MGDVGTGLYNLCLVLSFGSFRKSIAVVGSGTFRTYNQGHPQRGPVEIVLGFEELQQWSLDARDLPVLQQEDQPGEGMCVLSLRRM